MKIFARARNALINALSHLLYIFIHRNYSNFEEININAIRVYHEVLIISVAFFSGEVDVDREKRFHTRHLSRCLTSSRGKTTTRGTCQRFVYFDEFRARQDRMSPLRRPERRSQLSLWFWLPSALAATPTPL